MNEKNYIEKVFKVKYNSLSPTQLRLIRGTIWYSFYRFQKSVYDIIVTIFSK